MTTFTTSKLFRMDADAWGVWRSREPEAAESLVDWLHHLGGENTHIKECRLGEGWVEIVTYCLPPNTTGRNVRWIIDRKTQTMMTVTTRYLTTSGPPAWFSLTEAP